MTPSGPRGMLVVLGGFMVGVMISLLTILRRSAREAARAPLHVGVMQVAGDPPDTRFAGPMPNRSIGQSA